MVVNLQQIKNTGKATAMDIRQFAFAGINIYEALSKATGKPITEVKNLSVSYDMLTMALAKAHQAGGIYANGLENMAGNTSVQISNLGDAIFQLSVKIFDDLKPQITAAITTMQSWIGTAREIWDWLMRNKTAVGEVAYWVKIAGEAYLVYRAALISIALYTRAAMAITALFGTSIAANTVATTANTVAAVVNTRTWMGAAEAMRAEAVANPNRYHRYRSFGAAWASVGIGALLIGITAVVNKLIDMNEEMEQALDKKYKLTDTKQFNEQDETKYSSLREQVNVISTLSKPSQQAAFDAANELKTSYADKLPILEDRVNRLKAAAAAANTVIGTHSESQGEGVHVLVKDYAESNSNKRAKINSDLAESMQVLGATLKHYQGVEGMFGILKKNGITSGRGNMANMGGTSAATQSALNTSALSGARGGLGEAKVINIHIDTVQKNIGVTGKGVQDNAENAVDILIRAVNNMAYSQGSM